MSRKGENIYKRKDGRWEGRYIKSRDKSGKAAYGYVYAKTYREAKNKLQQHRIAAQQAEAAPVQPSETFQVFAQQWLLSIAPQIKESSMVKYTTILQKHLFPVFGAMLASEISTGMIEEFRNTLLSSGGKHGEGLAPKTVSDILSVFRSVLRYASRNGERIHCDARSVFIKQAYPQIQILSLAEQRILVEYLLHQPGNYSIGILLSLFMGLRVGEVCALRWEDISFSEQILRVEKTMQRIQRQTTDGAKTAVIITPPKSSASIRNVPIPDAIFQCLLDYRTSVTGYLLTNCTDRFVEPRTMQYQFKRIMKQCAIADTNYHTLRHTFATRCVEAGFDIKSLSEILGHSSVSITMNRYVHPSMELKKQNMQRLSQLCAVR